MHQLELYLTNSHLTIQLQIPKTNTRYKIINPQSLIFSMVL